MTRATRPSSSKKQQVQSTLEAASLYLPMDRRQALAQDLSLPDHAEGATLFADISGFTPLTEALVQVLGPQRGTEELPQHLNRVYDALIAEVHHYGGSVIGFSGDAITCWFDSDAGLRATACALAMQRAMAPFDAIQIPGGGLVELAMKAAVASGVVRRFLVGDPEIQLIEVLAGETLDRMAATEQHSRKGEVLLDPHTATRLGTHLHVAEWREGYAVAQALHTVVEPQPWPPLAPNALRGAQIRPWLLAPVYDRLLAGQGDFLAELRPAVALFLRFGEIDYDHDEAAGEKLDAYIRWVQDVLSHYEGSLIQVTMGDKGSYLYAAFGAPLAHEEEAEHAVAAALDLRVLPGTLGFIEGVQIGISRGHMRAGAYGGSMHRTYGVLGDEVNVAARLMGQARPGQLLISQRVRETVGESFEVASLGLIKVKGKTMSMPIFEVLARHRYPAAVAEGALSSPTRRPAAPLVGRRAERALLVAHLDQLRNARAGSAVILIEGEAGIGKSRLIEALGQEAASRGVRCYVGGGDAIEEATPYYAWRAIFAQLLDLFSLSQEVEAQRAHLLQQLSVDPTRAPLAALLNPLLPFDLPDSEATRHLSGNARAAATRTLLVQLLHDAVAQVPTVLVLEDGHWLDSASWELIAALLQTVPSTPAPLLLVIASRPLSEPLPEPYAALRAAPYTHHLPLTTLSEEESITLVCQRLGVASLPAPVAQLISERAQGNPFFSEELAYALRESGLIQIVEGQCLLTTTTEEWQAIEFPETVQGVIASRVDRLSPAQQLVLKVASIIGRVFDLRLLRDIYPIKGEKAALVEHLKTLEQLDITPLETPAPNLSYIFKHIITQEVVYQRLLFAQRRQLHQAVATWYERVYQSDPSPHYALLSHHWLLAAEAEDRDSPAASKALTYLGLAAGQALLVSAFREARTFAEKALALIAEDDPRLIVIAQKLGEAQRGLGEFQEAQRCFQEGLALARALGDQQGCTNSLNSLGRLAFDQGAYLEARGYLEESLPLAQVLGAQPAAALAMLNLGNVALYLGDYEEARRQYEQSLALSQQMGDRVQVASCLNNLGIVARRLGAYADSKRFLEEALPVFQEVGDRRGMSNALSNLGLLATEMGEYAEARRRHQETLRVREQIGNRLGIAGTLNNLGVVALALGDDKEAARVLHKSLEMATEMGALQVTMEVLTGLARLRLRAGQPEAALELLGLALGHPASNSGVARSAAPILAELRAQLPAAVIEERMAQGKAQDLDEVVSALFDRLRRPPTSSTD